MADQGNTTAARTWRLDWRRGVRVALSGIGILLLAMLAANAWIITSTQARIYDHIQRLPPRSIALVLGTSPYTTSGAPNLFFEYRMRAAARLIATGTVEHLLVSGANPGYYNEPQEMYEALRRRGVTAAQITLDFAGYSTFDSIVRSRRIFGTDRYIIVSQRFHDYRALFIAAHSGIDAVAYVLPQEDPRQSLATNVREYFARVKAVLDLFVWDADPRYLGPRVEMNVAVPGREWACYKPASVHTWLLRQPWRRSRPAGGSHEQTVE